MSLDEIKVTCVRCHDVFIVGGFVQDIDPRTWRCIGCRRWREPITKHERQTGLPAARAAVERYGRTAA